MAITNAQRTKIENKIYKVMDILDKSKLNSSHYRQMFADMSNAKFERLMKTDFPFRFHSVPFKVEPRMDDIIEALDYLKVPLLEKISLPYMYKNDKGEPVWSKECMVVYIHLKKVQQFSTHKNNIASNIKSRDMKTGLLTFEDKGGKESDRESESLLAMGLTNTSKELTTVRADYMNAKTDAYNTISNTGMLELDDIDIKQSDSLSKNLLNTYIISSMGISNILSPTYETKYTMEQKKHESK